MSRCRMLRRCSSPTALISLYPNPELRQVAEEVEATLVAIMKEAAG